MDASNDGKVGSMWKPNPDKCTNAAKFRQCINNKFNTNLESYHDLYRWSVENYDEFWGELWSFADVKHSKMYNQVIDRSKLICDIPAWFEGSRLNYAENMLRFRGDRTAVYAAREGLDEIKKKSFTELHSEVARYAAAMRRMGIKKGDRVVGYIPNGIEALAAMLAASSIGAIWSSTSPEFGVTGVLDRFSQIQPRLIFSVNAVRYNGRVHNHMEKLETVVSSLQDLERVVVIPYVIDNGFTIDLSSIQNGCLLDDFLSSGDSEDGTTPELVFEQLPFDHPLFIMYSSGTTGPPKCMVHSQGGVLMKHLEEHMLQGNMTTDDVILYYTTTGWMMWNWFVSALAVGSAVVCYDGSPLVPHHNVLWNLVDKIEITVLGTGAKWLDVLEERGVKPGQTHSLASLHTILSTGSPLKPRSFDYVYRDIKADLMLGSITGGSDILGCFAGQSSDLPVYRGEIQCRLLGMAMESFDEEGKPVLGESGELVCTKPFPSMPTHFWRDEDGSKYSKAYFQKFESVWAHGDFCIVNASTGGIWMLGRSDGTLNPNGVRFGSAEIYRIVEAVSGVQDSLCVAQRSSDLVEERVILFLKMAQGREFTTDVVKQVKVAVRTQLSARHVPGVILEVKDIPYTHSGKKVEVAVKKVIAGQNVTARGAFSNPDSLDLYYNLPELQGF